MIYFLMFLGVALSIVKANGWFVVPSFCIWFCWITSFVSWLAFLLGQVFAKQVAKSIKFKIDGKDVTH